MKGIQEILFALRAGYSFFYVRSWEQNRDAEQLQQAIEQFELNGSNPFSTYKWNMEGAKGDPAELLNELDELDKGTVMIAMNYDWFVKDGQSINYDVVQKILNRAERYSTNDGRRAFIIIGSNTFADAIPDILKKLFLDVEMELPDEEELNSILDNIVKAASKNKDFLPPSEEERELIVQNSKGMPSTAVTNCYAYSIIKDKGKLVPLTIAEMQAKEVNSTRGLSIGKYNVPEPIGMDQLKLFIRKTVLGKLGREMAKGILLLGPPGTGKTHFAKWVGMISGLKVIFVEFAELFGGIVGDTERNVARFLEIVNANAPCVVFIDEIEKGLAGLNKQGNGVSSTGDAGLTEKAFAPFLKWMSDERPAGVYVIATCNSIDKMPGEWIRAERWDTAPFYIGLPDTDLRNSLFDFYKKQYNVSGEVESSDGWSGAEIKSVCRIAAMMESDLSEAERFIIPISRTMKADIDRLNKRAKDIAIPANMPVTGKVSKTDRAIQL